MVEVVFIVTQHPTVYTQAYYKVEEVVAVENGTDFEATTIAWGTTVTFTITNICQLKKMLYLYILQFIQLQTKVEAELKVPTS